MDLATQRVAVHTAAPCFLKSPQRKNAMKLRNVMIITALSALPFAAFAEGGGPASSKPAGTVGAEITNNAAAGASSNRAAGAPANTGATGAGAGASVGADVGVDAKRGKAGAKAGTSIDA